MKKTNLRNKLLAGFLAMAMIMTGTATTMLYKADTTAVLAAEMDFNQDGVLNITKYGKDTNAGTLKGAVFTAYKVMDITKDASGKVTYTPTQDFADFFGEGKIEIDEFMNYSTAEIEAKAFEMAKVSSGMQGKVSSPTNDEGKTSITFDASSGELGYYLIEETTVPEGYVAGKPFFISVPQTKADGSGWEYVINAYPKNSAVSIDKEIQHGKNEDAAGLNDEVIFKISTMIPTFSDNVYHFVDANHSTKSGAQFIIHDTMCKGLTFGGKDKMTVTVGNQKMTEGTDTYSVIVDHTSNDETTITIKFANEFLKNHKEDSVLVDYVATVNENAVIGVEGNPNKVMLEYSTTPGVTSESDEVEVKVYSFGINIKKFTGENIALEGAEFELYDDNNTLIATGVSEAQTGYVVFKANGASTSIQLDAGTYYIKEIKAPEGYTLLANPIKVEIIEPDNHHFVVNNVMNVTVKVDGKNIITHSTGFTTGVNQSKDTITVAVENHKGFTLPSTGGMGITLFLVTGVAGMVCLAMIMNRKMKEKE